jgi:uncharacterized protein DUF397
VDVILVRDTTDRDGGTLAFGAAAWQRFIKGFIKRVHQEPVGGSH